MRIKIAPVLAGGNSLRGSRSRDKGQQDIMTEKQVRKKNRELELERIRLENIKEREAAAQRKEDMYKQSLGNSFANA